ncbi:hypothetical protein JB92DRAFT_3080487 [Gautieria morchelliformis]|nr:hypothetical protein JB92DRAFT_3080487 [Gautieria morchelliformis]
MSIVNFQVCICTKNAFPDMDECEEWAEECWQNAYDRKGEMHPPTLHLTTLITARGSMIQGRVKDKAVTNVITHYNFRHGQQPRQIEYNKTLAAQLLEDDVVPSKKKANGIIYGPSFNPIPESTIALAFTAVYYAVHQWTSGIHIKGSNGTDVGYPEALAHHQQRMHDQRCTHAGFPNNPTNPRKLASLDEDELDS